MDYKKINKKKCEKYVAVLRHIIVFGEKTKPGRPDSMVLI